jgi:hypothetical protein
MREFMGVFRIGLFLPYITSSMPTWTNLRDVLRENGFSSSFLVRDYSTRGFENDREKSFYFLRNCHVAFFVIEAEVGKGGVISELEEYKREVYPDKGKTVFLFEMCSDAGNKLKEEPSSVITPNLTEDKFYVRRFTNRNELSSMFLGAAKKAFYDAYLKPYSILDTPRYRLTCQFCEKAESSYICIDRCRNRCEVYHLCVECLESCRDHDCLHSFPESIEEFYGPE